MDTSLILFVELVFCFLHTHILPTMAPLPSLSTVVAWLAASSANIFTARTNDADNGIAKRDHGPYSKAPAYTVLNPDVRDPVAGSYVAVYKTAVSDSAVKAHQAQVAHTVARRNLARRQVADKANIRLPGLAHDDTLISAIQIKGFRALALDGADDQTMIEIYDAPEIEYLEQNCVVSATDIATESDAPDGLSRISHALPDPGSGYVYDNTAGYGITAYVVDTGIQINHTDFQGRAIWGTNVINNVIGDDMGHGTHVAGIIGGRNYGVAKNCQLVAVKALDSTGHATMSDVLKAFDWVVANATGRGLSGRAVLSIPITGGKLKSANDAVTAVVNAGIVLVTAAGNNGDNSTATLSPASAPDAITVSAINQTSDERVYWANYGPDVTVFAAGCDVLSTYIGPTTSGLATQSGTSVSVPHVAGLAAYLMKLEDIYDPRTVKRRIVELAGQTGAMVWNNGPNTTGLIANNGNL